MGDRSLIKAPFFHVNGRCENRDSWNNFYNSNEGGMHDEL